MTSTEMIKDNKFKHLFNIVKLNILNICKLYYHKIVDLVG